MELTTTVGVSNRHIHLTKETFKKLFDLEELPKKNDLNQLGQYASIYTLTIKNGERQIDNVRILGPFRSYDQVEISKTDAYYLKLNPPVRTSGDLANSEQITLIGPKGEVHLSSNVIIANRHLHINSKDKEKYQVTNNQRVYIHIEGEKRGIIEAYTKISDDGYFELHLDTDDANAFLLKNGSEVKVTYEI